MKKRNAFTLVELLAVIVILAIILVIAVPKVMSIIKDAKKGTLETTAKMIASSAEKKKLENTILESEETIECKSVTKLNDTDYPVCNITFDGNTAKVTITGGGQFEGLHVCDATKTLATATDEECGSSSSNKRSLGDDDWETIVAAVQDAETNGTEYPYEVGSEKTIELGGGLGTHTIRVANTTKCAGLSVTSKTACGFVLEFADIITSAKMNNNIAEQKNAGGWPTTNVRTYLNNENDATSLYNLLPTALSEKIINTYVVSGHGKDDTSGNLDDDNFGYDDKIYLLSTMEVLGNDPFGADTAATVEITRQLDYYKNNDAIKIYQGSADSWWLRSASSYAADGFHVINASGSWSDSGVFNAKGVSPAFRLGE